MVFNQARNNTSKTSIMNQKTKELPTGSAQQVIAHAKWSRSRGRNPSMSFGGLRKPREALALALWSVKKAS